MICARQLAGDALTFGERDLEHVLDLAVLYDDLLDSGK
jgi:hypothetical protein